MRNLINIAWLCLYEPGYSNMCTIHPGNYWAMLLCACAQRKGKRLSTYVFLEETKFFLCYMNEIHITWMEGNIKIVKAEADNLSKASIIRMVEPVRQHRETLKASYYREKNQNHTSSSDSSSFKYFSTVKETFWTFHLHSPLPPILATSFRPQCAGFLMGHWHK